MGGCVTEWVQLTVQDAADLSKGSVLVCLSLIQCARIGPQRPQKKTSSIVNHKKCQKCKRAQPSRQLSAPSKQMTRMQIEIRRQFLDRRAAIPIAIQGLGRWVLVAAPPAQLWACKARRLLLALISSFPRFCQRHLRHLQERRGQGPALQPSRCRLRACSPTHPPTAQTCAATWQLACITQKLTRRQQLSPGYSGLGLPSLKRIAGFLCLVLRAHGRVLR